MGTWGAGAFDDDVAADWAGDLHDAPPWQRAWRLRVALTRAAAARGYLERDVGAVALAAASVVAAGCSGGPPLDGAYAPGPEVLSRLRFRRLDRALAARAVRRVLAEDSEWRELWEEAEEFDVAADHWQPVLRTLRQH